MLELSQILHACLRLSCNTLNYDLHMKGITDSSLCTSGTIECAIHYLLHCPNFAHQHQQKFTHHHQQFILMHISVPCPLITNNLLQSNKKLSLDQIEIAFTGVQKYIMATKQFNTLIKLAGVWAAGFISCCIYCDAQKHSYQRRTNIYFIRLFAYIVMLRNITFNSFNHIVRVPGQNQNFRGPSTTSECQAPSEEAVCTIDKEDNLSTSETVKV